ncbi:hypothetical protein [Bdellovibrio sp.]|uniref:hypothetical protein n=1 Tax=Bdellovibrio sp. TaxID=28201 RepID=UPI0039E66D63
MKTKVLSALLVLSLLWAFTVSFLYWRLKNNPRVVAVTMDVGKDTLQNTLLGEMEKTTFLRQYLERYFNYDSNNFWQSQTSLAFLMDPRLREERLREVRRLREKIQQKNLSQLGKLISLKRTSQNHYEGVLSLQITEERLKSDLSVTLEISLVSAERTLENPWGLLVEEMIFKKSTPTPAQVESRASVEPHSPTLLTFPCAITNIENPDENKLKTKITTLNVSELQITPSEILAQPLVLIALCKDLEFKVEILTAEKEQDLYLSLPLSAGVPKKKEAPKARKRDIYEKTIDKVLGIKFED